MIRRNKKPNRGGGRANKPRGQSSRTDGKVDLNDDDDVSVDCDFEDEDMDDIEEGERTGIVAESMVKEPVKYEQRRPRRAKIAPVQKLHMSSENQELIRELLERIHIKPEKIELESSKLEERKNNRRLTARQARENEAYWQRVGDQRLIVQGGVHFARPSQKTEEQLNFEKANYYSLQKLQSYGFDRERAVEALKACNEDTGVAVEHLVQSSCHWKPAEERDDESVKQESKELRDEECLALESIYVDTFEQTITDKVWVMKFSLDYLTDAVKERKLKERKKKKVKEPEKEICQYFARKGHCKYGVHCWFRHLKPEDVEFERQKEEMVNAEVEDVPFPYELQVRFPAGSTYPFEAPVVLFSNVNKVLEPTVCLNITTRLMKEALSLAESASPAVFTLASILEDQEEILPILDAVPAEYSLPETVSVTEGMQGRTVNQTNAEIADSSGGKQNNSKKRLNKKSVERSANKGKSESQQDSPTEGKQNINMNRDLKRAFDKLQHSSSYQNMLKERKKLPAWDSQRKILKSLESHQVLVVSGMTGCGKTTQIPQFILDSFLSKEEASECYIICTQPRRISAVSVAERVSSERTERIGGAVGYQIRLETVQSASTRLLYCTTGILLRRLEGDGMLKGVSHVIVDEVHERTEEGDFLMMVLRDLIMERKDLRVILMSATLNAELFSTYFYDAPVIHIPGRTFPVEQYFLEDALHFTKFVVEPGSPFARPSKLANAQFQDNDAEIKTGKQVGPPPNHILDQNLNKKQIQLRYSGQSKAVQNALSNIDHEKINLELIESLLEWIVSGDHEFARGAILVFLPGLAEIKSLYEQLQGSATFSHKNKDKYSIIPLHSMLSSEEQSIVFQKPKEGVTKIVLSTNIAETSVTIDDIVFVIDSGKMKETRYDSSKGMESLDEVWVSKANANQRKGRAGRVQSGVCFFLFTQHRYNYHLPKHQTPEIKRVPLEKLCLRIKMLSLFSGYEVKNVLSRLLEPPAAESISDSISRLVTLGALDDMESLTSLGYHLAPLPVDVRIGKLMLLGAIFHCLDPALTIAASLSYRSPFQAPFERREEADKKRQEMAVGKSDHLTLLKAYRGWIEASENGYNNGYKYCHSNFLSIKTLQMLSSLKCQYAELLSASGFIQSGLTSRALERKAPRTGDGVLAGTGPQANQYASNNKVILALLCAALYPNVVQVVKPSATYSSSTGGALVKDPKAAEIKFWTKSEGQAFIHPKSINFQVNYFETPYLIYHEKVKTSKVYIRDTSMIGIYPLLLLCGGSLKVDLEMGQFVVSIDDGWIRFAAPSNEVAVLVKELRLELDRLLAEKIENPGLDLVTCPRGSLIVDTIVKLISSQ